MQNGAVDVTKPFSLLVHRASAVIKFLPGARFGPVFGVHSVGIWPQNVAQKGPASGGALVGHLGATSPRVWAPLRKDSHETGNTGA